MQRKEATNINECWSKDFVPDMLFNGKRFRAVTKADSFSRESLAIEEEQGIHGEQVVDVIGWLKFVRGIPKVIRVNNGPEFISKIMDKWAYENGVTLLFSPPGKPTGSAFVEFFNGTFRDKGLKIDGFLVERYPG